MSDDAPETAPEIKTAAAPRLNLRFVSHSEVGPVRKNNQDSGFASPRLLVVADGMGGAAAGDLASAVAIDTIKAAGDGNTAGATSDLDELSDLVHRANERIADLIEADHHLEGMGTTVTGAIFDGTAFALVHIGDSRAYLLRDGRLEQLTHDHSWVQSLVDDGKISAEEAAVHPHRSLLLKVLNGQPANDPDTTTVPVQAGDRLLFCSDGVCGLVDDPVIAEALALPTVQDALDRLVGEALAEGGIDNITAIVAELVEGDSEGAVAVLGAAAERDIPSPESLAGAQDEELEDTVIRAAEHPPTAAEDESRYDPQPPRRWRFVRPVVGLLVVVLVAGAALGAAFAWTRTQFFVGRSGDDVAIFRGLPEGLPGISLSSVYEIQSLKITTLPQYYVDEVSAGIEVSSLDAARRTVTELRGVAARCASPSPGPTSRPTSQADGPPSASASVSTTLPTPLPTKNPPASSAPPRSTAPAGTGGPAGPSASSSASRAPTPPLEC